MSAFRRHLKYIFISPFTSSSNAFEVFLQLTSYNKLLTYTVIYLLTIQSISAVNGLVIQLVFTCALCNDADVVLSAVRAEVADGVSSR